MILESAEAKLKEFVRRNEKFNDMDEERISHFILCAAMRKGEKREWFLKLEALLYRLRILNSSSGAYKDLAEDLGCEEEILFKNKPEHQSIWRDLGIIQENKNDGNPSAIVYRIVFEKASDLLAKRKHPLKNGYIYFKESDIKYLLKSKSVINLLESRFINFLRERLIKADEEFVEDNRISQYLNHDILSVVTEYKSHHININNLEDEMQHFPLCMKYLHRQLIKNKHLKHQARLQYILFLKGIGVILDDAIEFWQKSVDESSFKKNNLQYIIRHSYGKEGKRLNYTPYSCKKIIGFSSSDSDHGCPFKNKSISKLEVMLTSDSVEKSDQQKILEYVRDSNCGEACKMYFKATHSGYVFEDELVHPNQYYDRSKLRR